MIYLTGAGLTPQTTKAITANSDFGLLVQPASYGRGHAEKFSTWAIDNGCFTLGERFDLDRYLRYCEGLRGLPGCRFATAPDVVGDPVKTWERSEPVLKILRGMGYQAAIVAQDGFERMDWDYSLFDAVFLGGSTEWKLGAAFGAAFDAKAMGKWLHMGRVNSHRRLKVAKRFMCDSVDGTFLGFGPDTNLPKLSRWMRDVNGQGEFAWRNR